MATTFPLATYPLSDRTRFEDEHVVARDRLDDGNMRIRVLSGSTFRTINCVFENMSASTASTFEAYLITNRATEFDMTVDSESPVTTYRGYIWSDPKTSVSNGVLYTVSFDFRGIVV